MRLRPALVLIVSAAVAATLAGAPVQAAPNPEPVVETSTAVAAQALDEVQDVLSGKSNRDLTLALRELRQQRDELSPADQAAAARLLARPSAERTTCFTRVCVHWSPSGSDRATADWVDRVGAISDDVLATYEDAGYRPPLSDGSRGGDGRLDIYLKNTGAGLYGWCDTDTAPSDPGPYDTWAYCVLDNDYADFPAHTPRENLQVTAAHELFHAVQFGYDYYEDSWFMEATATWAEDELYDGVNDNRQYLAESPLAQPHRSMDHSSGMRVYGDWIFFRHLSERFTDADGGLPSVVRDIWRNADGSAGARDDYSIKAVARTLADRGMPLRRVWARFANANRRPGATYDEGSAREYRPAPLTGRVTLSGSRRSVNRTQRIDHLASATLRIDRAAGMTARRLRLRLDLPDVRRGSGVVATVYRTTGRPQTAPIGLSRRGNTTASIDFGRDVRRVEVTLANAGIHYRCWRPADTGYSCRGRPQDDDLAFALRATALR